jgi:gamma-glutamyltranspeptidase/glutathione hydrolase
MFTTRPEIRGVFGVAAATHWLAASTAMAVLERGGNAFDAACAGGFVLQVVEPHLNGPLGDLPVLLWDAKREKVEAVCAQGPAPMAATIDAFQGLGLDLIPGSGLLAACVPGAMSGWLTLLRDYGTWRLADVLEFAIGYAGHGYPLVGGIASAIAAVEPLFRNEWRSSAAVYLPGGDIPKPGSLFRNQALAGFYARLVAEGETAGSGREPQIERAMRALREGFVAEAIVRHCHAAPMMDASGRQHFGLLAGDDLVRWDARIEAPLSCDYHGWTVFKCGPWSQGPVLLQALALLREVDVAGMDPVGSDFVHTIAEALKLVLADREAWYADPDFSDAPMTQLLSEDYAKTRRALIGAEASFDLRPGSPGGRAPRLPKFASGGEPHRGSIGATGEPTLARPDGRTRGDTCHIDVIDRWGNMVAATPSGGWLQSSPVIPELGVPLGTRMQMFWLAEDLPGALAPGKRPRTTLTPSLALRDGQPAMVFGTPGGDQQDQWSLAFFLRHVHHGLNLQEAIDAPAFHTDHAPSSFWPRTARPGSLVVEERFSPQVVADLENRGHLVEVGPPWSEGRLSACSQTLDDEHRRLLRAAANARGMQGYAVGR